METSAPKRRRTSPRTSVPVHSVNEASQAEATGPAPSQPSATGKRPSFASPTKASLERHNPEILRRRQSPPKQARSEQNPPLSASRPSSRGSIGGLSRATATHLEERDDNGDNTPTPSLREGEHPSEGGSILRSPARRPGVKHAFNPKPRPLPPPGPSDDEEVLDPFARGGLRRSPTGGLLAEAEVPEPELPPTPDHPDPVVSTPPSGIHNTPSRRPKRSKALAERIKSSSPLKNPPVVGSSDQADAPPVLKLSARPNKPSKLNKTSRPAEPGPTTAELRGLEPNDPDAAKKKERDALLAEIAALERDLEIASKENARQAEAHSSKAQLPPPNNGDEILDLLRRRVLPPDKEPAADPSTSWLQSALDPIAFLPFSKPTPLPSSLFSPSASEEDHPPPVSHHPLPMTAAEALPFLRVFTPLTFTSHITLPDPSSPKPSLLQQHSITATSTAPRGLFTARVNMTVDTRTMTVTDLSVPRLDPAAVAELTPFIDRVLSKQQTPSSGLSNNVNVLMWSMGEWLRLATQRARVWHILDQELGADKEALQEMVERMREKRQKQKRRRRRVRGEDGEEDDGAGEGEEEGGKLVTVELLPFMGRTSMDFEVPLLKGTGEASTLRVQWKIGFDWTGEGRSEVGVLVGVPGKWYKCDERGRISGIPGLFDELIKGGETPLDAVRTVASLLAGEQRA